MSKKSRRTRAKFKAIQSGPSVGKVKHPENIATISQPGVTKSATPTSGVTQVVRQQHIVSELWRIAIIAGILFIAIIVLSFIIK